MIGTKSFAEHVAEDRRLALLRFLAEAPSYTANESILRQCLASVGHNVSRDQLRTDLAWLQEQGLVVVEELVHVHVARIQQRGEDVASGRAVVPGVKRPGP